MAENLLEKQLDEVRTELASAKAQNDAIRAKIEEAKDKEFASRVEAFEGEIQNKDTSIAELEESIKSTQARVAELEDALAKSQDELSVATKEMEEQKRIAQLEKRKAALAEAGLDEEEIEDSLANFDALADEAFESVIALVTKKMKGKKDEKDEDAEATMPPEVKEAIEKKKKEKEAKADEEAEAEITQEAFEEVETSEATLVETEVEDEMETTRASVANWLENHVLNK